MHKTFTYEERWKRHIGSRIHTLSYELEEGEGLNDAAKETNYSLIRDVMSKAGITDDDIRNSGKREDQIVGGLVNILRTRLKWSTLEWQKPTVNPEVARALETLKKDKSNVFEEDIYGVWVQLDNAQLKHQHKDCPIGTRQATGGNRFNDTCNIDWHKANTLKYMARWAGELAEMEEGQEKFHGQTTAVDFDGNPKNDGIHYDGFCLFAGGKKYVSFHCYPANDNKLKWDEKKKKK